MPHFICTIVVTLAYIIPLTSFSQNTDAEKLKAAESDTARISALIKLSQKNILLDSAKAMLYAKQALEKAEGITFNRYKAAAQRINGSVLNQQGRFSMACQFFHRALTLSSDAREKMEAMEGLGFAFMRQSEFDSAKFYLDKCLALSSAMKDVHSQAHELSVLASAYLNKNELQQAQAFFMKSADLYEETQDTSGVNAALNNIGNIEYRLGHYEKAIQYINESRRSAKKIGDLASYHYSNKVLARIYRKQGKFTEALAAYQESIPWYEKTGSRHDLSEVHLSIGNIYFEQELFQPAIAQYHRALYHARITNERAMIPYVLFAIGSAYAEQRLTTRAFAYLDSVEAEHPDSYIRLDMLELRANLYQQKGDYKKAITFIKKRTLLSDSITNAENRAVLVETEAKYQNEKKQQEIEDLQAQKALDDLKLQQQQIVIAAVLVILLLAGVSAWYIYINRSRKAEIMRLKELGTLNEQIAETRQVALRLQMNPHFIFNCIAAIDALILREERRTASNVLNKFARLLRQILENSSHNLISLEKDVECLSLYVQLEQLRFSEGFAFDLILPNDVIAASYQVPPLIFQPYVENAIIHGLRHKVGSRKLSVIFESLDDNTLRISVRDNGIGRRRSAEINVTTERHQSLGSVITEQRLHLIRASNNISANVEIADAFPDEIDTGTEVVITLKWLASKIFD